MKTLITNFEELLKHDSTPVITVSKKSQTQPCKHPHASFDQNMERNKVLTMAAFGQLKNI